MVSLPKIPTLSPLILMPEKEHTCFTLSARPECQTAFSKSLKRYAITVV